MLTRIFFYVLQLLVYVGLLWLGFDQAGMELPGPIDAPWLWALVGVAPLIPAHWGCWDFAADGSSALCESGD